VFVKRSGSAPACFFACEAAGLQWLSAVERGVPCATVISYDDTSLTLEKLDVTPPSRTAAYDFGRRLARTHAAGAEAFGAPPQGWTGPGYFGPLQQPLPMSYARGDRWGSFYANERLAPMTDRAAPQLDAPTRDAIDSVMARCDAGEFDDDDPPARLHGDLWSGNVMWTPGGAVLIDPAAHGGHRETDLAMLALIACPHYQAQIEAKQPQRRKRGGWRDRVGLHQLYPLLAHVVLFGGGYARQTAIAAASALRAGKQRFA
jgi:fructosamine-3-kinase